MTRKPGFDWHVREWLEAYDLLPAELQRRAGWSKRKISELMTGQMRYNRDVLNEAAVALNIAPHELLMHPADAAQVRSLLAAAKPVHLNLVGEDRTAFNAELPIEPLPFARSGTNG